MDILTRNSYFSYLFATLPLQMSGPVYDSFVVIGDRRSLPQADTGHHTGGLRHRSNDSSVSMSPPANGDAVLDLSDSKLRFRLGHHMLLIHRSSKIKLCLLGMGLRDVWQLRHQESLSLIKFHHRRAHTIRRMRSSSTLTLVLKETTGTYFQT